MNLSDSKYSQYALVREMMDTIDVVKGFDPAQTTGGENGRCTVQFLGEGATAYPFQDRQALNIE